MTAAAELPVINQSQVKLWRECQKAWDYKYRLQLQPKQRHLPFFRGSWLHSCLETHYRDGDWKIGYNAVLAEFNKLFDEERNLLNRRGNLPDQVKRIMESYIWYTRRDNWETIATEKTFDIVFQGVRIKGTIDLVIMDLDTGYTWMIDHKTVTSIPPSSAFHSMDPQLMLYPWAAEKAWGLEITGIMWNYIKSKPPTVPKLNRDGSLSRRKVLTDYPTAYKFFRREGYDPKDFSDVLRPLMKNSPFIRRYRRPREIQVTDRIITEYLMTAQEILYAREGADIVRHITKDCARCPYQQMCQMELNGGDISRMMKKDFIVEDITQKHGDYTPA